MATRKTTRTAGTTTTTKRRAVKKAVPSRAFKPTAANIVQPTTYVKPLKVLVLAFNKHIQREFEQRIGSVMQSTMTQQFLVGSEEQTEIWNALVNHDEHLLIEAVAGSGKTTTAIDGIKRLMVKHRGNVEVVVKTYHAHGMNAIGKVARENWLRVKVEEYAVDNWLRKAGVRDKDDWREVSGLIKRLVAVVKGSLVPDDDEETLVKLADHHGLDTSGVFRAAVPYVWAYVKYSGAEVRSEIGFDDMPWLPVRLGLDLGTWDMVFVDEAQDTNPVQMAMVERMVKKGARVVVLGDTHQCQPEGTLVYVTGKGAVKIEDLEIGDQLVSFNSRKTYFPGVLSQGRKVLDKKSREYAGEIIRVGTITGSYASRYTPEHRCLVRLTNDENKYATYIMRRGDTVRVGVAKLQYIGGFGVAMRARQERADEAWVLGIYDGKERAMAEEQFVSTKFGISQVVFVNTGQATPTQDFIDDLYERLTYEDDAMEKLRQCLGYYGRDIKYPIWSNARSNYVGKRSFITQACNLVDNGMRMKVFNGSATDSRWLEVRVSREQYIGKVVSLMVERAEDGRRLYVADGIVTHNSIYGFRGADVRAMGRLKDMLKGTREVEELGLTYTRRCAKNVVTLAQTVVPYIKALESAEDGSVRYMSEDRGEDGKLVVRDEKALFKAATDGVGDGDMVLCRMNAPLISFAYGVLKRGVKCTIKGRDIGVGLVSIVRERLTGDTPAEFVTSLKAWFEEEEGKLLRLGERGVNKLAALGDKYDCLWALIETIEGGKWIGGVEGGTESFKLKMVERIEGLFSDEAVSGVICGTVHKMKGLEADRVWIIKPEVMPHPKAKGWSLEQEYNIMYVAVTRARRELVVVGGRFEKRKEEEE